MENQKNMPMHDKMKTMTEKNKKEMTPEMREKMKLERMDMDMQMGGMMKNKKSS